MKLQINWSNALKENKRLIALFILLIVTYSLYFYLHKLANPKVEGPLFFPSGDYGRIQIPLKGISDFKKIPLENRLYSSSPELAHYLNDKGFSKSAALQTIPLDIKTPPEEITALLKDLPLSLKKLATEKLIGIYFVSQMAQSTMSFYVYDRLDAYTPYGAIFIIDLSYFYRDKKLISADQWLEERERRLLNLQKGIEITARLQDKPEQVNPFAYPLLLELATLIAMNDRIYPPEELARWGENEKQLPFPFFKKSWSFDTDPKSSLIKPLPENEIKELAAFKHSTVLGVSQIEALYKALSKTNFPTLLSTKSPKNDFAESFAQYVHTNEIGQPFEITFKKNGKVFWTQKPCWAEPRCSEKKRILDQQIQILKQQALKP